MRKLCKQILGAIILAIVVLGILKGINIVGSWLCEDMGRYMLGMGIIGYIIYKLVKKELE